MLGNKSLEHLTLESITLKKPLKDGNNKNIQDIIYRRIRYEYKQIENNLNKI